MVSEQKKNIRHLIKELKNKEDKKTWKSRSEKIFSHITSLDCFKNAKSILAFWSLPDEVITTSFIAEWHHKKNIYLPVVNGNDLRIVKFEGENTLIAEQKFGILEPSSSIEVEIRDIDLAIIPGVAFDSKCNRLGRGKGYYDRLLKESVAIKIGVCFDFQIVAAVPTESFDIPLDLVVAESAAYIPKNQ